MYEWRLSASRKLAKEAGVLDVSWLISFLLHCRTDLEAILLIDTLRQHFLEKFTKSPAPLVPSAAEEARPAADTPGFRRGPKHPRARRVYD